MISLGCPKNLVDSELMLGLLEKAGYRIVTDPGAAEVLIVNTCGFIEDAKRESIEAVLEMAQFKEMGRAKHLVVTGCLPQRYKDELIDLFPEVDLFVGTGDYPRIAQFIKQLDKTRTPSAKGGSASGGANQKTRIREYENTRMRVGVPEYIHTAKTPRKIATRPHAVYVKIAEGCFHGCSFCSIPKMRGKYRSRKESDIVKEVKALISGGAKELNIIAQDTTGYGRDLKGSNIVTLLEKISMISGEKWIRLLYTYPQTFRKGLLRLMKESRDICRYIDMPIQHIDDSVLFKMRRGRSEKKIRKIVEDIKTELPDIALRTSIITGFPGETERQFKKLLAFVEEGYFDHVGAFAYSEEEGTGAARLKGHLPEKIKNDRRRAIMRAQKKISKKRLKKYVGQKIKILVEGVSAETDYLLESRAEFQAPDIDGVVYINDGKAQPGKFYWVEISDSYDYDLVGGVI